MGASHALGGEGSAYSYAVTTARGRDPAAQPNSSPIIHLHHPSRRPVHRRAIIFSPFHPPPSIFRLSMYEISSGSAHL